MHAYHHKIHELFYLLQSKAVSCSAHWFGCLERHKISVFLVLIFITAWSNATQNRSSACWSLCSYDASKSSTKSSAKTKCLTLRSFNQDPQEEGVAAAPHQGP